MQTVTLTIDGEAAVGRDDENAVFLQQERAVAAAQLQRGLLYETDFQNTAVFRRFAINAAAHIVLPVMVVFLHQRMGKGYPFEGKNIQLGVHGHHLWKKYNKDI